MSSDDWLDNELQPPPPPPTNSKKKSKKAARPVDDPVDDTFDNMLESAEKSANPKSKPSRRAIAESAGGWSNEINDDHGSLDISTMPPSQSTMVRQSNRRAAEEIIAADIPTIPMDDADGDDTINMAPEVAVAPEFSIHQIASFKEIENDFCRERASQYIDSKIDIGILYNNLHLQEELDAEEQKLWDWDKVFVEIRNSITNPST
ncbi:unnamed protein product [Rotaria socialis]|uniref:Uncharacterized protein n=2 Tax=Rotaria socialis TaxID=392032 RepID=A0A818AXV9_9BILA|nr:unnamed protein product [Rotaria socialis]CAF3411822.1 unnamed protein product [Rotaria socialis]CAF3527530.1 unnamed protein product [Rotaria socialis]CAF3540240.1 unnamed protein product [Rotaria socialis]CAF3703311.1 unnamed protein product [Rotaria socialis]